MIDGRPWTTRGAAVLVLLLIGCSGTQSALSPKGRGAEEMATLFWWMSAGAVVVWAAVLALVVYAVRVHPDRGRRRTALMIVGGGAVVPTVVLTGLLVYGLSIMPPLLASVPDGTMRIFVRGEQWWWRVRYLPADGRYVDLANEIRLPVGEPVEFHLDSPDVIHSFWIPSLGGKMDMIPGRRTRLVLHPTKTGTFRGACAEYCGTSHALMAFPVVVMEKEAFARWLDDQRAPAGEPLAAEATRGRDAFFANGCPACHAVRGTSARGVVGPDLTHVGSRLTVGAGIVPNDRDGFALWLARTEAVKPAVHMPSFGMLPRGELTALAAYLESLQ
ncbi:MAG TPA: cytochrome c oxidase subunit II [Thermoanaerobaculia bacterium]|nr:cytochrome c oxidase subunit II [Thermoanaerobaculia bacterium]